MPATFPSPPVLRVPTTRTLTVPTDKVEFLNGSEQRWRAGLPLNAIELIFNDVMTSDLTALRNFVATVKGAFDSTWSIVWADGATYSAMALEQDDLPAVADKANTRWSCRMKMRQAASSGSTTPAYSSATTYGWGSVVLYTDGKYYFSIQSGNLNHTPSSSPTWWSTGIYPKLPNGCITQRPFTQNGKFLTTRNDVPNGPRYAYAEWPAAHGAWIASYPVITLAELAGLLNFFIAMGGRYSTFSFTDPITSAAHANCRFDSDAFAAKYVGGLQWSVALPIAEFVP